MSSFEPGCLLIRAEGDVTRFLNTCAAEKLAVQRFCSTGSVSFGYIPAREWKRAKILAEKSGAALSIVEKDGISYTYLRYKKRIGLIIWPILATGLLLFSQCFLWAIDVNGCETLSPQVILSAAAEAGLYKGRFLPSCDMEKVADYILAELPGVGFCAVNKIGSRVEIEINEIAEIPIVLPSDPCNIIAAETGKIVYMEVYNGQENVKVGEAVGKGQQLVTGITESADGKTRYVHASAKIIADASFSHDFTLDIKQKEKTYTGQTVHRYSIELFGGKIPLYLPDGVEEALSAFRQVMRKAGRFLFDGPEPDAQPEQPQEILWDTEITRAPLTILGVQLPLGLVTEAREAYTETDRAFTEEEALSLLQDAASAWEEENLADGEIKEKEEQMEIQEDTAVLHVDYLCQMDIASPRKVEVTFTEENPVK